MYAYTCFYLGDCDSQNWFSEHLAGPLPHGLVFLDFWIFGDLGLKEPVGEGGLEEGGGIVGMEFAHEIGAMGFDGIFDDGGNVANAKVFFVDSDIEGLVVYVLDRRVEYGVEGA